MVLAIVDDVRKMILRKGLNGLMNNLHLRNFSNWPLYRKELQEYSDWFRDQRNIEELSIHLNMSDGQNRITELSMNLLKELIAYIEKGFKKDVIFF